MRTPIRIAAATVILALVVPVVGVRADVVGPQPVDITIQTTLGNPSHGPFVATGAAVDGGLVCLSGRTVDVSLVTTADPTIAGATDFDVLKVFTCGAEGVPDSGSFVLRLLVRTDPFGQNGTFTWTVMGASGRFAGMSGSGTGYATAASYGVDDHLSGYMQAGPASPSVSSRLAGTWMTTDCAQYRRRVNGTHAYDCSRWGDKSPQTLSIGTGSVPTVRLVDAYASQCVRLGKPGRFTAAGYGRYLSSSRLRFVVTDGRCGTTRVALLSSLEVVLTTSSSGAMYDELWWDSDPHPTSTHDWGYVFYRAAQ